MLEFKFYVAMLLCIVAQSSGSRSVTNSLLSQELKLCFSDTKFTKAPDTKLTKAPETKRY